MADVPRTRWGELKKVSYFVQGYLDLEDVLSSVDKMIETNTSEGERTAVKRVCRMTAIPLPNRSAGMVLHLWIPEGAIDSSLEQQGTQAT